MAPDASAGRALHAGRGPLLGGLGESMVAMATLSFAEAMAMIKADENQTVATLVINDKALQAIIACWPMVMREVSADPVPADQATLEHLWAQVRFDEHEVMELSGLSSGVALAALRRARGNRLIYPDGSVHRIAQGVLQQMLRDALNPRGKTR